MEYAPLVLLAAVAVGAAVLFYYMRRLKRSARQALEQARTLEARVRAFRVPNAADAVNPPVEPPDEHPPSPGPTER